MRVIYVSEVYDIGLEATMAEARRVVGDGPTYVSFDIDSLDPAFAPGTGTPEVGGFTSLEAQTMLRALRGLDLIGADVVEVSPPFDPSGLTALTGASIMFELLCVLADAVAARKSRRLGLLPPAIVHRPRAAACAVSWSIATVIVLLAPSALLVIYRFLPVPITPLMVIRLIQGEGLNRMWVPLEAIAPALPQAVIAAEDNRFCEHAGFDWQELEGQIDALLAGGRARGASTITMQTAKNLFLWPGRDLVRKALEAWFTPQIELLWPKRRIIEVYLNIAEFGPGIYGAEAAARAYSASRREVCRNESRRCSPPCCPVRAAGHRRVPPSIFRTARAPFAPGSISSARCSAASGPPEEPVRAMAVPRGAAQGCKADRARHHSNRAVA